MVTVISRSAWGARAPRSRTFVPKYERTDFTIHYSAGPKTQTMRSIQDYHMGPTRQYSDVGYNRAVDYEGNAYEGRGWDVQGAHATGHNRSAVGVCFIGVDGDITDAAKRTLRALYADANAHFGKVLRKTYHGGLSGNSTSCPGAQLRAWVQAGMPAPDGSTPVPVQPGTKPPYGFPLLTGHWFGPESSDPRNHSGYWAADRTHISVIRNQLRARGWIGVPPGDRYDLALADRVKTFQREKNLVPDGLVGSVTWPVLWTAPIT